MSVNAAQWAEMVPEVQNQRTAWRVLNGLCELADGMGEYEDGQERLANYLGASTSTISAGYKQLRRADLIYQTKGDGNQLIVIAPWRSHRETDGTQLDA
jgi:hypothetical protein